MKKEKKFLDELDAKLVGVSKKDKETILSKYQEIIKTRKENKERIKDILKSIGTPEEVALKEIEEYKGKNSFKYKFNKVFSSIKQFVHDDLNRDKEKEKKQQEERAKKREEKKKIREEKRKVKAEQKKLLKEEKEKAKLERKNNKDKEQKDKSKKSFKNFLSIFKKHKKDTIKDEIEESKEEINEEIEEVEEEVKSEISEVTNIATETKIFETKEQRISRIILNVIKVIFTTILIFIWLWVSVVFIASVFAYLDGVKLYGLVIGLFGIDLFVLLLIIFVNKSIFSKKISRKWPFIFMLLSVLIIASGIAIFMKQIYKINTTADVSEKYSMTKKTSSYNLPSDNKNLYVTFNSNYDTDYIVEYDKTLNNKVNVEVKYYECYYDYYSKKDNNNLYISLRLDKRDRLSVYIDDLKEGKIYDNNELSRYVVKITLNERDKNRVIIK